MHWTILLSTPLSLWTSIITLGKKMMTKKHCFLKYFGFTYQPSKIWKPYDISDQSVNFFLASWNHYELIKLVALWPFKSTSNAYSFMGKVFGIFVESLLLYLTSIMLNKVPRYILKIKIEDIQYYRMEQILKPYFLRNKILRHSYSSSKKLKYR